MRYASWIAAVFLAGLCATLNAQQKPYTMEDLRVLDQRKSWEELIGHLLDVPPAKRNAEWNKMVGDGCFAFENLDEPYAEYCTILLKSVTEAEPANTGFAWKAAHWVRRNRASWSAVPFYIKAGLKSGDERCKDSDLPVALVSALSLPQDVNAIVIAQAQRLAFDACWPATKEPLMKEFADGNSYFLGNVCKGLKSKDALSAEQAKRCEGM